MTPNCTGTAACCDIHANLAGPEIGLEGPRRIDGGRPLEAMGRRNMKLGLIDYLSAAGRTNSKPSTGVAAESEGGERVSERASPLREPR